MHPDLMVVGLSYRTAPVEVRERYWIAEERRDETLAQLVALPGIEEVLFLSTRSRTEFVLWASDPSTAANSILKFLTRHYDLSLSDWQRFYRKLDEQAVLHVIRLASTLDSMSVGQSEIVALLRAEWLRARKRGTAGRVLNTVCERAIAISEQIQKETAIGVGALSIPCAAVELARRIFGALTERKILMIGSAHDAEACSVCLASKKVGSLCVASGDSDGAQALAEELGGRAVALDGLVAELERADVVINSVPGPAPVLDHATVSAVMARRERAPLCVIDLAVPRGIEPAVREVDDVFLYHIDDLQQALNIVDSSRQAALAQAEKIVAEKAHELRRRLLSERVVPGVVTAIERLEQICRQEIEALRQENGPLSAEQEDALDSLLQRLLPRLGSILAQSGGVILEGSEQEQAAALLRQFQLGLTRTRAARSQN